MRRMRDPYESLLGANAGERRCRSYCVRLVPYHCPEDCFRTGYRSDRSYGRARHHVWELVFLDNRHDRGVNLHVGIDEYVTCASIAIEP